MNPVRQFASLSSLRQKTLSSVWLVDSAAARESMRQAQRRREWPRRSGSQAVAVAPGAQTVPLKTRMIPRMDMEAKFGTEFSIIGWSRVQLACICHRLVPDAGQDIKEVVRFAEGAQVWPASNIQSANHRAPRSNQSGTGRSPICWPEIFAGCVLGCTLIGNNSWFTVCRAYPFEAKIHGSESSAFIGRGE